MTAPSRFLGLPLSLALVVAVGMIAAIGYVLARRRALARAGGDARGLHSLPRYYGSAAALLQVCRPWACSSSGCLASPR